jgi:transcriptional regulator with XRE-family HTH domain
MKTNVVNGDYWRIVGEIAQRIKLVLQERGINQGNVATHLGQNQSYISKIESGRQAITAVELKLLADFYKRPITDFFD